MKSQAEGLVIKADGLASGKGVIVCRTQQQAVTALRVMMLDKKFADAGNKVVVEKRLTGKKVSYIAICDGISFVLSRLAGTTNEHTTMIKGKYRGYGLILSSPYGRQKIGGSDK